MTGTNSLEARIHSLVGLLGSAVGKVLGTDDVRSGLERLAVASILPIVTTSIFYYARTTVEVVDPEQSLWVQLWIVQQKKSIRRVRRLLVLSQSLLRGRRDPYGYDNRRDNGEDEDIEGRLDRFAPPKLTFLPAGGVSAWAWFGMWPISIASLESLRDQDKYGQSFAGSVGYKLTIWFAPWGVDVAKNLLFEGRKMWLAKRAQKTEIWMHISRHSPASFDIATRKSRPLNSVIIEAGIKDELLADTKRFLQSEEWYVRKGIPYRRGYLLHGPPGCGKTSFITALAGSLRLPIVLIALGSKSIGDEELLEVLSAAPRDSIVLIEDVDCAFRVEDRNEARMGFSRAVTMSGLLNAIDGVAAQEGRLIFLTTNHKEQLNEALIRPGRVDAQFYLGYASKAGAGELFDQFFPPLEGPDGENVILARDAFVNEVESNVHSFAKLQGVLMQARDEPELAAQGMRGLFTPDELNGLNPIEVKKLKGSKVTRLERLDENIESHLALITHAAKCEGCTSSNCRSVKKCFEHIKTCNEKPKSSCKTCTSIINLCVVHAQKCTIQGECPVPYCVRIRKKEEQEEAAFVKSIFEESDPAKEEEPVSAATKSDSMSELAESRG